MRRTKRTLDAADSIRSVIAELFSCSAFSASRFTLPSASGAQISLTGDIVACGNQSSPSLGTGRLKKLLASIPFLYKGKDGEKLDGYIKASRYYLLCGDCDRSVAIASSASEIISSGVRKLIIAADTVSERDNIFSSLHLMRSTLSGAEVLTYRPSMYTNGAEYNLKATVYAFLTSESPSILILGRDSFCRCNNFIRRKLDSDSSLASLISLARPVILTSSATVSSGRALAKCTEPLDPSVTLVFSGEVRPIRDAVIYKPITSATIPEKKNAPEQLSF